MSELCLKDEVVLKIRDIDGRPSEVAAIVNPELLPICLKRNCTTKTFFDWLNKRAMPSNREGCDEVIRIFSDKFLKENTHYQSLTDHYWLRKRNEKWKSINFFTNRYDTKVGDMFFCPWKVTNNKNFGDSPDLTTGGVTKKCWRQYEKKFESYLIKSKNINGVKSQTPLGEVLVSVFCEKLNKIECVHYDLHMEGVDICSRCDNFVTVDTDFVPAAYLYFDEVKKPDVTSYSHLLKMCEKFGCPDAKSYIDWIVFIDAITGNCDRNLNNMGFIRDIKTLKIIKPAPLFDSGNGYWNITNNNEPMSSSMFKAVEEEICKKLISQCSIKDFDSKNLATVIQRYPDLLDAQKERLIEEIEKRNTAIYKGDFTYGR